MLLHGKPTPWNAWFQVIAQPYVACYHYVDILLQHCFRFTKEVDWTSPNSFLRFVKTFFWGQNRYSWTRNVRNNTLIHRWKTTLLLLSCRTKKFIDWFCQKFSFFPQYDIQIRIAVTMVEENKQQFHTFISNSNPIFIVSPQQMHWCLCLY